MKRFPRQSTHQAGARGSKRAGKGSAERKHRENYPGGPRARKGGKGEVKREGWKRKGGER
jgi:hypothetical protein